DTYASFAATPKLTLAGEFDHVVSRIFTNSPPSRVIGGVGYLQYHFTPKFSVAGRFQYLKDRGGLFCRETPGPKDHTFTATYQPIEGFQIRLEHRRDFSNHRFFLTETPGMLDKQQNTATLGLLWWFGGKRESW